MATKREIIAMAMEELGYADYNLEFDEVEFKASLRRLDLLIGSWEAKGLPVRYSKLGGVSVDEESGVTDGALQAVVLNLAIALAPRIGKALQPETVRQAHMAWHALLNMTSQPREMSLHSLPRGAGAKSRYSVFLARPTDIIDNSEDIEV